LLLLCTAAASAVSAVVGIALLAAVLRAGEKR